MTAALVSVIIPCYKQAGYLPEAIDSVLAQTYTPIEVIVVNDGSPDDTEQVAQRYGDRIRYLARPNGGISAARNSGSAAARGDYIKFLDADDLLHREQIAWQMAALAGRQDAVSFTSCRLFRDGHPEQYLDHIPQARNLLPDLFQEHDWGGILCFLFPRALVQAVGSFAEGVHHAEDWHFCCRIGLLGAAFLPDPRIGCYYRQRAGSLSTDRSAWIRSQARLTLELHDALRKSGRPEWFGRDLLEFEQGVYENLMRMRLPDNDLRIGTLRNLKELQAKLGLFGKYGWRFRLLARLLGYANAEHLRGFLVRLLRIQPPQTLDTAEWRAQA